VKLLIVDVANVMGSRPDGWWRDRAGAARRIGVQLAEAGLPFDEVVLVLEGAARRGLPQGSDNGVRVLHAPGSGDDEIVAAARDAVGVGREVTVVTADRGLRSRVEAIGAGLEGPSWLLERL
jgi:hypothetical protein